MVKFVRYNEVPPYILLLLGKEKRSLYRGFRYIEVRYIEVSLYGGSLYRGFRYIEVGYIEVFVI